MPQPEATALKKAAKARHLAGHAVMALLLGHPVQALSLFADDDDMGLVLAGDVGALPVRDWLLISLAGRHAESRFLGWKSGPTRYESAGRLAFDMINVLRTFERRGIQSAGISAHLRERIGSMLNALFDDPAIWEAITRAAEALIQKGSLSPETLEALIPEAARQAAGRCRGFECGL